MTSNQKTFAVALSREMVPTARIAVFYIRQPEEIVVDVLNFFVDGTGQNQVKLDVNLGKDFSRDTIEINAYADPGSYAAFSAILLDLYSRGLSDGITENKVRTFYSSIVKFSFIVSAVNFKNPAKVFFMRV